MTRTTRSDATGNAFESRGRYFARPSLGGGKRKAVLLQHATDQVMADRRAALIAALVAQIRRAGKAAIVDLEKIVEEAAAATDAQMKELGELVEGICQGSETPTGARAGQPGKTFKEIGEAWTSGELASQFPDYIRTKRTAQDDEYRLEILYKHVGPTAIDRFSLDDAEATMGKLPKELSAASRRHYAQLMSRVLGLACYPLRLIKASPLPRGWLPKIGKKKAKALLYPKEEGASLACESIPLPLRVFYGFLAREGLRAGEAVRLRIRDVDLKHGSLTLDENKTDDPRAWALNPGVRRALKIWVEHFRNAATEDAVLFVDEHGAPIEVDGLAGAYRHQLEHVVKLERRELFERTPSRLPIRVHDLRGAFITYSLAEGHSETWVADRTGHQSSTMINRYRRAARSAKELALGELGPLDELIPELAYVAAKGGSSDEEELTKTTEKTNQTNDFGLVAQSVELRTFNP